MRWVPLALVGGEETGPDEAVRRIPRGERLLPGQEPHALPDRKSLASGRVSEHAIAIIE